MQYTGLYTDSVPTTENLDELQEYLRMVIPQWKLVHQLKKNLEFGFIDFKWNGHHFAVKPSLEAFEIKVNKLFVTAGSLLLQSALMTRTGNETKISAVVDTLDQAEDVIRAHPEEGLILVAAAKKAIAGMAGAKITR